MPLSFGIPRVESQIVTPSGSVSRDWYLFFASILQTIGGNDQVVPGGSGISPTDAAQQFEEYATTSIEAVEALSGVSELRNELATLRSNNDQLRSLVEELSARISDFPTNDLRQRVEAIEGRLA